MKPTPTPEMIEAAKKALVKYSVLMPVDAAISDALSAALSVQPAAAVVGEPACYQHRYKWKHSDKWTEWGPFNPTLNSYADWQEQMRPLYAAPSAPEGEKPAGLSKWSGWDRSNLPWSEAKHKDRVCYAAFGETWSMEDAHALISFIDLTWGGASHE